MNNKQKAIYTLESIARWMNKSSFNYSIKDLRKSLDEVVEHYKNHLSE